jgi:hypothetical protein
MLIIINVTKYPHTVTMIKIVWIKHYQKFFPWFQLKKNFFIFGIKRKCYFFILRKNPFSFIFKSPCCNHNHSDCKGSGVVWHRNIQDARDNMSNLLVSMQLIYSYNIIYTYIYELRHDKTNIMRLRPAWI